MPRVQTQVSASQSWALRWKICCIFVAPCALDVAERPYRHFDETAPVRLLFVAQLIPRKGLSRLLRALALPSLSELHLTVAGSGPDRDDLETMARSLDLGERVRFLGFVAQEDLSALYARHDLFVFPTLEDTFGMVTLEAMAAGLPVIASSRAGSTRDFVREGENGWICEPAPDSIAAALERALRQRAAWPAVGQRNREAVKTASPGSFRTPATRRCEPSVGGITVLGCGGEDLAR